MNILVIGDIGVIFTYEFITEILAKIPNCKVDVLSFSPKTDKYDNREKVLKELGCNIFYQPKYAFFKKNKFLHIFIRIFEFFRYGICKKYDIINIHFLGIDSVFATVYSKKNSRIVSSIYGSDVLRANNTTKRALNALLKKSDTITVATNNIKKYVSDNFGEECLNKTVIAKYGSIASDYMGRMIKQFDAEKSKKQFSLPSEKYIVLCGYNASPAHRHIEVISLLSKLPQSTRDKVYLLFHCSYGGSPEYISKIQNALDECGISGKIVTDFLQGENLAMFRKSADVFLNLQPTDVLSASMIEELEAGAVVVKGDWLSYPDLDNRGAFMCSIPTMESLAETVDEIVNNFNSFCAKTSVNNGITSVLSWEEEYPHWCSAIFGDEKKGTIL